MTNQQIDFLLNIGYNMAQVSQLIKLQNDGFSVDVASDLKTSTLLMAKDNDEYRIFRQNMQKIETNDKQKKCFFNAFINNIDYMMPLNAKMNINNSIYIIGLLQKIKDDLLNIDITPMLNETYSMDLLKQIWSDLIAGIDVNIYLNSSLISKRKIILREALINGINIEKDLLEFSFLTESDIPFLKTLITEKFDYFNILKKFKNTEVTLYLCRFQKETKTNPLTFLNNKMSFAVIKELCNLKKENKKVDFFKSIHITNKDEINLFIKIDELGYPVKKCKNLVEKSLNYIIDAIGMGLTHEQIDELVKMKYYVTIDLILHCYKYEQLEYIDFFKNNENIFLFDYEKSIKLLLEHNFNNKDNAYDINELLFNNGKIVSASDVEYYAKLIQTTNIDKTFFNTLKNGGFTLKQMKMIINTKQDGYDVSCMLDPNLTIEHLKAIRTCLGLGLSIKKEKEYDLPKYDSSKEIDNNWYKSYRLFEFDDYDIKYINY